MKLESPNAEPARWWNRDGDPLKTFGFQGSKCFRSTFVMSGCGFTSPATDDDDDDDDDEDEDEDEDEDKDDDATVIGVTEPSGHSIYSSPGLRTPQQAPASTGCGDDDIYGAPSPYPQ